MSGVEKGIQLIMCSSPAPCEDAAYPSGLTQYSSSGSSTYHESPPRIRSVLQVRALYDYTSDDNTSLSFQQGDVIHVLNQLESGWWDGVINGVRGWFPSNYCAVITSSLHSDDDDDDADDDDADDDDDDDDDNVDEYANDEKVDGETNVNLTPTMNFLPNELREKFVVNALLDGDHGKNHDQDNDDQSTHKLPLSFKGPSSSLERVYHGTMREHILPPYLEKAAAGNSDPILHTLLDDPRRESKPCESLRLFQGHDNVAYHYVDGNWQNGNDNVASPSRSGGVDVMNHERFARFANTTNADVDTDECTSPDEFSIKDKEGERKSSFGYEVTEAAGSVLYSHGRSSTIPVNPVHYSVDHRNHDDYDDDDDDDDGDGDNEHSESMIRDSMGNKALKSGNLTGRGCRIKPKPALGGAGTATTTTTTTTSTPTPTPTSTWKSVSTAATTSIASSSSSLLHPPQVSTLSNPSNLCKRPETGTSAENASSYLDSTSTTLPSGNGSEKPALQTANGTLNAMASAHSDEYTTVPPTFSSPVYRNKVKYDSVTKSDHEAAAFWIPQATRDGKLFYYNTLTGVSTTELPLEAPLSPCDTGPKYPFQIVGSNNTSVDTQSTPIPTLSEYTPSDDDGIDVNGILSDDIETKSSLAQDSIYEKLRRKDVSWSENHPEHHLPPRTGRTLLPILYRTFNSGKTDSVTWERLLDDIERSIERYRRAIESSDRTNFVKRAEDISDHLRVILVAASGTSDSISGSAGRMVLNKDGKKFSDPSTNHHSTGNELYAYFRNTMSRFSKLVLSSHIASVDWPPPEAYAKCLLECEGLADEVKSFVKLVRRELGDEVGRLIPGFLNGSFAGGSWKNNNLEILDTLPVDIDDEDNRYDPITHPIQEDDLDDAATSRRVPSKNDHPVPSHHDVIATFPLKESGNGSDHDWNSVMNSGRILGLMEVLERGIFSSLRNLEDTLMKVMKVNKKNELMITMISRTEHETLGSRICRSGLKVLESCKPWLELIEMVNVLDMQKICSRYSSKANQSCNVGVAPDSDEVTNYNCRNEIEFHEHSLIVDKMAQEFLVQKQRVYDESGELLLSCQNVTRYLNDEWSKKRRKREDRRHHQISDSTDGLIDRVTMSGGGLGEDESDQDEDSLNKRFEIILFVIENLELATRNLHLLLQYIYDISLMTLMASFGPTNSQNIPSSQSISTSTTTSTASTLSSATTNITTDYASVHNNYKPHSANEGGGGGNDGIKSMLPGEGDREVEKGPESFDVNGSGGASAGNGTILGSTSNVTGHTNSVSNATAFLTAKAQRFFNSAIPSPLPPSLSSNGTSGSHVTTVQQPGPLATIGSTHISNVSMNVNANVDEACINSRTGSVSNGVNEIPSFLGLDYENEIVYDVKSNFKLLKGGTLKGLVEQLTRHDRLDSPFNTTFLLTYKSFTTANELFDALVKRWFIAFPVTSTGASSTITTASSREASSNDHKLWIEKKQLPIRFRVVNILKSWIENYWMEDYNEASIALLKKILKFTREHVVSTNTPGSITLISVIEKRLKNLEVSNKRFIQNMSTAQTLTPILPKNLKKLKFLDIDPTEFGRQLTIIEFNLYNKIKAAECLNKIWQKSLDHDENDPAPHIKALILHSNKLTNWVAHMILNQQDVRKRVIVIKHFVAIADRCRQLNNFSTLTSIISALGTAPIHRLNRTWQGVNAKTMSTLESMRKLMGSTKNFAEYREALHKATPPCIPFFGVYLTDLTFIEDGIPSTLKKSNLINFSKRAKTAEVIRDIQDYQNVLYPLQAVPELQNYILSNMQLAGDVHDMYERSLAIEPREREDEKIARYVGNSFSFLR